MNKDLENHKLILNNSRRLITKRFINWHLYMEIFGTGSNTAIERCYEIGIDPHSYTTEKGGDSE